MLSKSGKECAMCQGTGKLVLMRSWFTSDGFRFGKCGVCSGTGKSNYRPASDSVAAQARLRKMFCVEA